MFVGPRPQQDIHFSLLRSCVLRHEAFGRSSRIDQKYSPHPFKIERSLRDHLGHLCQPNMASVVSGDVISEHCLKSS